MAIINHKMLPAKAPPKNLVGPSAWVKNNLFDGPINSLLTLAAIYILYLLVPGTLDWTLFSATWSGGAEACRINNEAACWPFIAVRWEQFMYGYYDQALRWRIDFALMLLFVGILILAVEEDTRQSAKWKPWVMGLLIGLIALFASLMIKHGAGLVTTLILSTVTAGVLLAFWNQQIRLKIGIFMLVIYPFIAFVLLKGGFGLKETSTNSWGGFTLTLVIALTGIVASLPLGVLLALGRRSEMKIIKTFSVIFIEFWRGVPLITVLFMASVMFPLFTPPDVEIDQLLRALVGVALFSSAYMAEVIRGGLAAIPKGQYEGAMSLGLPFWKMMRLIILPQALKIVIPGIVNTFIGLFKDTTLV